MFENPGRTLRRLATTLALGAIAGGALPAAASADAATAALGGPIVRASAQGVVEGTSRMRIVVECTAISVSPAASTRVSCSAGPASAGPVALPGPTAEAAGTGTGTLAPFTICVSGTTHAITGPDRSTSGCMASIGLTAAVVAA